MGDPSQAGQWLQPQAVQLSIISGSHACPRPPRHSDQALELTRAALRRGHQKVEQTQERRGGL